MNIRKLLVYVLYVACLIAALSAIRFIDSFFGPEKNNFALLTFVISSLIAVGIKRSLPTKDSHVCCPDCKELILKEANVCKFCGCKLITVE